MRPVVQWLCLVSLSLSPRPQTNPSADRFQYRMRGTGSDIRTGWGLGERLTVSLMTHRWVKDINSLDCRLSCLLVAKHQIYPLMKVL